MVELKNIEVGKHYKVSIADTDPSHEAYDCNEFVVYFDKEVSPGFVLMTLNVTECLEHQIDLIKELPGLLEIKDIHEIYEMDIFEEETLDSIVLYFVQDDRIETCLGFDVTFEHEITEDKSFGIHRCECNEVLEYGCACPERNELQAWTCPKCKEFTIINTKD